MFRFRKHHPAPPLDDAQILTARAERGTAPGRTIDTFTVFAGPDQTIEAADVEAYLHLLENPIKALRHEVALDGPTFDRVVMPMVQRYLAWVHLLPASQSHHHARLGGLALHGLDVATLSARAIHNAVLDYTPAMTRDLELRANRATFWPLAAATAGLMHDLGKVLIDQVVTAAHSGEVWNPFVLGLATWAKERGVDAYALRWRSGDRLHRHESFGLLLMGHIAGREVMDALSSLGRDVLEAVVTSISGERDDVTGLRDIVHRADAASCRADRDSGAAYWSEGTSNVDPIVSRLLDAAAGLIRRRAWRFNTPGHPAWVTPEGAYLLWPQAFNSMRQELVEQQKAVGVPDDPLEVAEIFIRAKVARRRELSNGQALPLWAIQIPGRDATSTGDAYGDFMAKLGAVSHALYFPDPSPLIQGQVVTEATGLTVMPDPTLPTIAGEPVTGPTTEVGAEDGQDDIPDEASPPAQGNEPPKGAEREAVSVPAVSATRPSPAGTSAEVSTATSASADAGSPPTADTGCVEDGAAVRIGAQEAARTLLTSAGGLGAVLLKIADLIAVEPGTYQPRDKVTQKGDIVLLRWPEAVRDEVKALRVLADEVLAHPEWLAPAFNGQPLEPASHGITVSTRIRNTSWNALPLSPDLSAAFTTLARRNAAPTASDLP